MRYLLLNQRALRAYDPELQEPVPGANTPDKNVPFCQPAAAFQRVSCSGQMKAGYLRVSTDEQRPDRQIDALRAVCDELHVETVSAVAKSRPVYEALIAGLKKGDTLVVWQVDRAYRSTVDAITEVEKLHQRNINFLIVSLDVDTATADGMLVYTVIAAMAQWERATLSERTKQGLAAARRRGKRLGRPPKLTPDQTKRALDLLAKPGATIDGIAQKFGVSGRTLARRLSELN